MDQPPDRTAMLRDGLPVAGSSPTHSVGSRGTVWTRSASYRFFQNDQRVLNASNSDGVSSRGGCTAELWAHVPLDKVLALVPRAIINMVKGTRKLHSSWESRFGALLMIDVSGFTTIANILEQHSEIGPEVLSEHLNEYFRRLLAVVKSYKGDVVLFSGDSIVVSWLDEPSSAWGEDSNTILTALECGDELINVAKQHDFTIKAGENNMRIKCCLGVHVGVAAGPIHHLIAGGAGADHLGRWRFLVVGATVEEVGAAVNLAKESQMVITREVQYLASRCGNLNLSVIPVDDENYVLVTSLKLRQPRKASNAQEEVVEGLPDGIKSTLTEFSFDTVARAVRRDTAELRTVNSVFIKLLSVNSTDPDATLKMVNSAICTVQKGLTNFDGVLNKAVMDDKGVILLCVFGLPGHTHEDDCERAVMFSVKVSRKLDKVVGPTAIGLARAKVFCGLTGSTWRNEYTVLGDGVNMACRLMQQAESIGKGTQRIIICDESVAKFANVANMGIIFSDECELVLRGRVKPVTFYQIRKGADMEDCIPALEGLWEDGTTLSRASSLSSLSSGSSFSTAHRLRSVCSNTKTSSTLSGLRSPGGRARFGLPLKNASVDSFRLDAHDYEDEDQQNSARKPQSRWGSGRTSPKITASRMTSTSSSPKAQGFSLMVAPRGRRRSQRSKGSASSKTSEDFRSPPEKDIEAAIHPNTSKIIGRSHELQYILGALRPGSTHHADDGARYKRVVCIFGDIQTGKSTLLGAASDYAHAMGITVVSMNGLESLERVPYGSLGILLPKLLESIQVLEHAVGPEHRQHLPLLHHVVRVSSVPLPNEQLLTMDPTAKIQAINGIVRSLIKRVAGDKAVLLVDDAQWLDDMSLGFINDYLSHNGKVILAGRQSAKEIVNRVSIIETVSSTSTEQGLQDEGFAVEGEKIRGALNQVLRSSVAHVIRLTPLSPEQHTQLLSSVIGHDTIDPTLDTTIREKADGAVGYSVQMVEALVAGGYIKIDGGIASCPRVEDIDEALVHAVPSVELYVMRIVDTLLDCERQVLQMAAVLGTTFSVEVLQKCVQELQENEGVSMGSRAFQRMFREVISSLLHIGLITDGRRKPEFIFSVKESPISIETVTSASTLIAADHNETLHFTRPLARDIVYQSTLLKVRRVQHEIAARVIAVTDTDHEAIRRHLRKASLLEKELTIYRDAYRSCTETNEIQTALKCLKHMLMMQGRSSPTEEHFSMALCLYELGQLFEASEVLEALLCTYRSPLSSEAPPLAWLCPCIFPRPELPVTEAKIRLEALALDAELAMWSLNPDRLLSAHNLIVSNIRYLGWRRWTSFESGTATVLGCAKPHDTLEWESPFSILAACSAVSGVRKIDAVPPTLCKPCSVSPMPSLNELEPTVTSGSSRRTYQVGPDRPSRPLTFYLTMALRATFEMVAGDGTVSVIVLKNSKDPRWNFYGQLLRYAARELCTPKLDLALIL
eukprot:Sspe_Gene.8276::Locus_2822_Transcript_1_1_Confidence_1.000_Length_4443::g.8276::m.8276/K11265/ADCY10; adenylate cyclase 10